MGPFGLGDCLKKNINLVKLFNLTVNTYVLKHKKGKKH